MAGASCPAGRGMGQSPGIFRQAGEKALARSAHREAWGPSSRRSALQHLPEQSATIEQAIDLRLALRVALLPSGQPGRILAYLREAEPLQRFSMTRIGWHRSCSFCQRYFRYMGSHDQALAPAQRALALTTAGGEVVLQAVVNRCNLGLGLSSHRATIAGRLTSFRQIVASRRGGRSATSAAARSTCPPCYPVPGSPGCHAELGMFAEGRALGEEGLRIAEAVITHRASCLPLGGWSAGPPPRRPAQGTPPARTGRGYLSGRRFRSISPGWLRPWGPRIRCPGGLPTPCRCSRRRRSRRLQGNMDKHRRPGLSLSEAHLLAGRLEEAHALAERALALARAHQERGRQAYALRLLGEIAARHEPLEVERAEAHYRQALALAEEFGMRPLQAHCHLGLGTLYAKTGQAEQARADPGRCHRPIPRHGHDFLAPTGRGVTGADRWPTRRRLRA